MSRTRRVLLLALGALLAGAAMRGLLAVVEAALEAKVRARIVSEAVERGFRAELERVRVRLPFRVLLTGLMLDGHGVTARVDRVDVRAGFAGHGLVGRLRRLESGPISAELPHGLSVRVAPSEWDVSERGGVAWLSGRSGEGAFALGRTAGGGADLRADRLDLTRLVRLRRDGVLVGDLGVVTGTLALSRTAGEGLAVEANLLSRQVRLGLPPEEDASVEASLGEPFDAVGSVSATLHPGARFVEVACATGDAAGLAGSARGVGVTAPGDAWIDVALVVPRLELGPLLAASGLELPAEDGDLGSAALEGRISGRMLDPKSWVVEETLDFRPPAQPLPEIERLRGPFRRVMTGRDGRRTPVAVDPESPDFVPLEEVPPHLVRGLLTSEDADFWGHPGIDLGEIPVAASMNWVRGRRARGASTITQQLAKNLFLTRERSYRRKLQEAALALLLESSLGKRRILEIYLNVIEWGPGLHGLGPAARHYFGKNPQDLTPREGAFLVALIPGPIKYQPSFAGGVLSRGFTRLVNGVLRRLASVGMLTDEELKAELETPLRLRWTPADVAGEELVAGGAGSGALEPDEEALDEVGVAPLDPVAPAAAGDPPAPPVLLASPASAPPAASPAPAAGAAKGSAAAQPPVATPLAKEPSGPPLPATPAVPRPVPRATAPAG